MAQIQSFQGTRYTDKVQLRDVISQPYDVLSAESIAQLKKQSTFNCVYLCKNPRPQQAQTYAHIPLIMNQWKEQKIIQQDAQPSLYGLETSFTFKGQHLSRRGIFALLNLETGQARVLPHEHTLDAAIKDRLALLEQSQTLLSPLFMIADDPNSNFQTALAALDFSQAVNIAATDDPLDHRFMTIEDAVTRQSIEDAINAHDLLIADGHHRHQTALRYAQRTGKTPLALAYITSSQSTGLVLSSIHRFVSTTVRASALAETLQSQHQTKVCPINFSVFEASHASFAMLDPEQETMTLCFDPKETIPTQFLQNDVFEKHLKMDLSKDADQKKMTYWKDPLKVRSQARTDAGIGFWVRPLELDHVFDVCKQGNILPQKSTYFYPKVPSGLVFAEL